MRVFIISFFLILLAMINAVGADDAENKQASAVLAFHFKHSTCDEKIKSLDDDDRMVVGKNLIVYKVRCITGAYQGSSNIYTLDARYGAISVWPVSFAVTQDGKAFFAQEGLTSAEFDTDTRTITSYYKSRGIGDCGATTKYKWREFGFYLVEAGYMPCCSRPDEKGTAQCKKFNKLRDESDEEYPIVYRYKK